MPYPLALNRLKAKTQESDGLLLEAITIPLIDVINHIPSYTKFLKGICTPNRNPKRIQLSEIVSSIMMNYLPDELDHVCFSLLLCVDSSHCSSLFLH